MYTRIKISLITNSREVVTVEINLGVTQGCSMSPMLFNLYLDNAVRHWQSQLKILHVHENLKKEEFIKTFVYAGNQVIISDNEETLQRALHEFNKVILDHNFDIPIQKTKKMTIFVKWPVKSKFLLYNQPTKQVSKFNYLGCQFSYQGEESW
jgi:hypothetical protein